LEGWSFTTKQHPLRRALSVRAFNTQRILRIEAAQSSL